MANRRMTLKIQGKNDQQNAYLESIRQNTITIVNGFAGTGKTFLATLYAIKEFLAERYNKVILTRPCVEAGEKIGYLPGSIEEKLAPHLIPVMDILEESLGKDVVDRLTRSKQILTIPVGYLRGITFKNSFVILDEAQNLTIEQMRLFLTRVGNGTKVVVTGDSRQSDIRGRNGFVDAIERFKGIDGIQIVELDQTCIVRHPLVALIEERYGTFDLEKTRTR